MGSEIFPSIMFMVFALVMGSLSFARKVRAAVVVPESPKFPQNPRRDYLAMLKSKKVLSGGL